MLSPDTIHIAGLGNNVARRFIDYLLKQKNNVALYDDALVNKSFKNCLIHGLQDLPNRAEQVVVIIFNPVAYDVVCEKIRQKGCFPIAFEQFIVEHQYPAQLAGFPNKEQIDDLTDCEQYFHDPLSIKTLYAIRQYWLTGKRLHLHNIHQSIDSIYFNESFLPYHKSQRFIDAGAFDGDSLRAMSHYFPQITEAHLFEPIEKPHSFPEGIKVNVYPIALGSDNRQITFEKSGLNSAQSSKGDTVVEQKTLDSFNLQTTFIKIDVEGQDIEVLRGAKKTILESRPVLAVSVYHSPEHLKEAADLIKNEYGYQQLFLRKYTMANDETVLYAIDKP